MTPRALLRAIVADRLGQAQADWPTLASVHGEALAPFAGLAPEDEPTTAKWRLQVSVEALGHLGTLRELLTFDLPFLTVKGVAWGALLWGDETARPAHDLDIVIPLADLKAWQRQLAGAGYQQGPSPLVWRRSRQIVQLHGPDTGRHWLHAVQPPWARFWERAVTEAIAGVPLRLPDPADTLLYLAHHQVFRHGLDHDQGWIDLAGWLRAYPASLLPTAWQRAADSHLGPSLAVLGWAWQELFGMPPLTGVPRPSVGLQWLAGYAARHPGEAQAQTALSLGLTRGDERRRLLRGLPGAIRRWGRWQRPPVGQEGF